MSLPKIQYTLHTFEIPSTKRKIKVRPMVSREEKILLVAKESGDPGDIMTAVKQVCNNCLAQDDVNIDVFTIFDLEMLFIKLRSISISNIVKVTYKDQEDEQTYDFDIDLDTIIVKYPESTFDNIIVNPQITLELQNPVATLYSDREFLDAVGRDSVNMLIKNIIKAIHTPEGAQKLEGTKDEINEFIESLPIKTREQLIEYIETLPTVYYNIEYKNQKGTERKIELRTLDDFFTLR